MKIFIDTADLEIIRKAADTGILDGVTTNPSLLAKQLQGRSDVAAAQIEVAKSILAAIKGDVSLEVLATEYEGMVNEGEALAALGTNAVVKLPMTIAGIKATKFLSSKGIKTNVTLVFSAAQALLAAKAGATYVSPFIGRLHDIGMDGQALIASIRDIYDNYAFHTQILAASDRTVLDTVMAAESGADAVTVKPENFFKLFEHPLTTTGLSKFTADWEEVKKSSSQTV
jgi:transaldolase